MRAEGTGHARAYRRLRGPLGDVPLDVVAAAEQQRDEDRLGGAEGGEGVGEQRLVEFDVPEVHGQTGALPPDAVQERLDGAQGARVTAAVRHDDERGRLRPRPGQELATGSR